MTTAAVFSIIALTIFIVNIGMSVTNLIARDEVVPQGLIWSTWLIGAAFLLISFVL